MGGRWRTRSPLRFFVISELISLAVLLIGAGILGAALPPSGSAHQPGGAIGGSLMGVGAALMVVFVVLGAIDLTRYPSNRRARPRTPGPGLAQPCSAKERPKPQPGPGPGGSPDSRQDARVQLPQDRRVSILMLGYPGSGKTIMLASLYRHFALGGSAGIRFATDDASNTELLRLGDSIRDAPSFPAGTRPGETKTWTFSVRVESGVQDAGAFTLEYLDYAGGYLRQLTGRGGDPPDQKFVQALADADVLMGVLDGDQVRHLMSGEYDPAVVVPIERLLNVLIRANQRNIHLIITKWDVMRGPGGSYYTVPDVITALERISDDFRRFRQHPRLASMRVIPVAALGLNGFVRFAELGASGMVRVPGVPWEPWNVEIPFFCAVPDILQNDVPKMEGRADGNLSRITIAALSLLNVVTTGVTAAMSFGLVNLTFQPSQFIDRLQAYLSIHNKRGQAPQNLGEREAVGYVVNECYAAAQEFELRMPGTRIGGQAVRAGGHGV